MKCFDVVEKVLDATYKEVPDGGGKKDQLIAQAIESSREQYGKKLMTHGGPVFDDAATRFGYVFSYVPAHAHWIYDLLDSNKDVAQIFNGGKARITCLGGGPGSDVVGILKYLDEKEIDCALFAEIIDGCEAWKKTWSDLAYELDWDNPFHTDYVIHDVGDKETWGSPSKIDKADLVTISFFASEIFHLETSEEYLRQMLARTKSGSFLIVIDNNTPKVFNSIDEIANASGYDTLLTDTQDARIYDHGERAAALKKYSEKFNSGSRLKGNIFRRVFRKA